MVYYNLCGVVTLKIILNNFANFGNLLLRYKLKCFSDNVLRFVSKVIRLRD